MLEKKLNYIVVESKKADIAISENKSEVTLYPNNGT